MSEALQIRENTPSGPREARTDTPATPEPSPCPCGCGGTVRAGNQWHRGACRLRWLHAHPTSPEAQDRARRVKRAKAVTRISRWGARTYGRCVEALERDGVALTRPQQVALRIVVAREVARIYRAGRHADRSEAYYHQRRYTQERVA